MGLQCILWQRHCTDFLPTQLLAVMWHVTWCTLAQYNACTRTSQAQWANENSKSQGICAAHVMVFEAFAGLHLVLQPVLLMNVLSQLICMARKASVHVIAVEQQFSVQASSAIVNGYAPYTTANACYIFADALYTTADACRRDSTTRHYLAGITRNLFTRQPQDVACAVSLTSEGIL